MYKSKITLWGLDKKQKRSDARSILRVKRKRAHDGRPPCLFVVRGWLVDEQDLERYCKRAKLDRMIDDQELDDQTLLLSDGDLPKDLLCVDANPHTINALQDPARFRVVRRLLHAITVQVESSFDSGIWNSTHSDQWFLCRSKVYLQDVSSLSRMISHVENACLLFSKALPDAAGRELRQGFHLLEHVAYSPYHDIVPEVLGLVARLRTTSFMEIGTLIVEHLANVTAQGRAAKVWASRDVFDTLRNPDLVIEECLSEAITSYLRRLYMARLGEDHVAVIELDLARERDKRLSSSATVLHSDVHSSIALFDRKFGPMSRRAIINMATKYQQVRSAGDLAFKSCIRERLISRLGPAEDTYQHVFGVPCFGGHHTPKIIRAIVWEAWLEAKSPQRERLLLLLDAYAPSQPPWLSVADIGPTRGRAAIKGLDGDQLLTLFFVNKLKEEEDSQPAGDKSTHNRIIDTAFRRPQASDGGNL